MATHFCAGMLYSMQPPFFPNEARRKNLRPSQYSLAFACFEVTGLIVSPFAGYIIKDLGSKYATCLALFTTGSALVIFGFLKHILSANLFLIYACLLRMLEAFGTNLYLVCGFTIISTLYSEAPSVKTSMLITSFYIGMTCGPVIGGMLHHFGGFILPFLVLAPNLLVACSIFAKLLPNAISANNNNNSSVSMLDIMKIPGVWVGLVGCCAFSFCQGILQPTLAKHMDVFEMSPQVLSLMFIISPAMNFLTSPFFGYLIQWGVKPRLLIALGTGINIVCFALIGPFPLHSNMQPVLWMVILGLFLNGMSAGMLFTCGFSDPQQVILKKGFPSTEETNGIISSLTMGSAFLGGFIGPVVGGGLQEGVGMSVGSMIVILINILVALIMFAIIFIEKEKKPKIFKSSEIEETTSLLKVT